MLGKSESNNQYLSRSTIWLMTIGAGVVVANNYYNQPLLAMIANDLKVSEEATSHIAMITQIGYAVGLLLIIPLGDMFHRKRIILIDFIFIILSLLAFAFSPSLNVAVVASFFIGLTSVIPQIFVPIAAQLSAPGDKDKNVAQVMSGLLVGILGSRVFSGILGDWIGWRPVFMIVAGVMVILALLIACMLPNVEPTFKGTYKQLVGSMVDIVKKIPPLRLAAVRGGLALGAFSIFWTTLTFHLEGAPFYAGSDIAGLLSLAGVGGALAATLIGHITGKVNKNYIITTAIVLLILSYVVFGFAGFSYVGLVIGILLLDIGLQSVHVTNQTIIFSTLPEASNRLNAIYMCSYFIGGAMGSSLGGIAWVNYGWTGVVLLGLIFVVLCLMVHLLFCNRKKYQLVK